MLVGLDSVLQKRYIESRTKKLEDNNAKNNNINITQIKTKSPFSKKQRTNKDSDKAFSKIRSTLPKLKMLLSVYKNCNNISKISKV